MVSFPQTASNVTSSAASSCRAFLEGSSRDAAPPVSDSTPHTASSNALGPNSPGACLQCVEFQRVVLGGMAMWDLTDR